MSMKFLGRRAVDYFWKSIIVPKSVDKDKARREFILHILLSGVIVLTATAFLANVINPIVYRSSYRAESPWVTGSVLGFLCVLLAMSRIGKSRFSAIILILLFFILGTYIDYRWGADAAVALLLYGLIVVMSGILIDSKFAFIMTILSGAVIISLSYLEITSLNKPDYNWKSQTIRMSDAIVYVLILGVISIVSWLANREMEKALKRARASEAVVKRQRDNLEITVERRTQELQLVQVEKIAQLSRFAQFGRTASGLFHDLANPLNLVSLNLDSLRRKSRKMDKKTLSEIKVLLQRAITGTQRLDAFIQAARRQVQQKEIEQSFSIVKEIIQIISMLGYRAKKAHVNISFTPHKDIKTFGNPVKFSQVITNLVLNAIDAYEDVERKTKAIEIRAQNLNGNVKLEIQDWGIGIEEKDIPNIFNPLFTTKTSEKRMGMGLSICKDIVEKDFKGTCTVESTYGVGTTFAITFPIRKAQKAV